MEPDRASVTPKDQQRPLRSGHVKEGLTGRRYYQMQGARNGGLWATPGLPPAFVSSYWNTATLIRLHIAYRSLCYNGRAE